jgi:hypothetical protein
METMAVERVLQPRPNQKVFQVISPIGKNPIQFALTLPGPKNVVSFGEVDLNEYSTLAEILSTADLLKKHTDSWLRGYCLEKDALTLLAAAEEVYWEVQQTPGGYISPAEAGQRVLNGIAVLIPF